ncbi:MAG: peptide chain release factor 2 [Candidatus Berkelbacteria bacterium]|nr:peptide chain release factor 2 [Candidatus Berkelbacteria bacterium]
MLIMTNDIQKKLDEFQTKMARPEFWQDKEKAKKIIQEYNELKTEQQSAKEKPEFFKGDYDQNNAIMLITAGTGGVEAQDWAGMLLRMYLRFAEKKGFTVELVDKNTGQEAGVKSASISVKGPYAFGWLKSENGVHRLVRISPFDADHARHTSFALVEVIPEIKSETERELEINPEDLRIDTFRASGAGGQYVQKTESAVRITHIPTKLSVSVQTERSQLSNKETALKILKSRIFQLKLKEREKEVAGIRGELLEASWGNQIRSYVLHPYKMVKDHRTGWETSNAEKFLDGEIEEGIKQFISNKE